MSSEAKLAVETLGTFIDERFTPWLHEHAGPDVAVKLNADCADWRPEPLFVSSAWRIENWRRGQRDVRTSPADSTIRSKMSR